MPTPARPLTQRPASRRVPKSVFACDPLGRGRRRGVGRRSGPQASGAAGKPASDYAVHKSVAVNRIVDLAHVASRRDPRLRIAAFRTWRTGCPRHRAGINDGASECEAWASNGCHAIQMRFPHAVLSTPPVRQRRPLLHSGRRRGERRCVTRRDRRRLQHLSGVRGLSGLSSRRGLELDHIFGIFAQRVPRPHRVR